MLLSSLAHGVPAPGLRRSAWLVLVVALAGGTDLRADPLRRLKADDYRNAVNARNRADEQRARIEQQITSDRNKAGPEKADPKMARETAGDVIRAYQAVIERYPHTDVAADCATALIGVYQFVGDFDEATKLAEQTANEFAGTRLGGRTAFNAGLVHASARSDPAEAIKWFSRVPKPIKRLGGLDYDEDDKYYYAAQQQLIKCEVQLREDEAAKARAARLKESMPQYTDQIDRELVVEVASRDGISPESVQWDKGSSLGRRAAVTVAAVVGLAFLARLYFRRHRTHPEEVTP
jgi:tetratricopeptide (TPR) repeat protein